jgi:nucleotide-binding universal stress UspA family protein
MFQRLLICTDFTDGLHRLAHFVPSLAVAGVKQVCFLHKVAMDSGRIPHPDQRKLEQARQQLQPALESGIPNIEVSVEVESGGKPDEVILRSARKHHSDLIVLGTETRTQLSEKLFGSTAMQLCQSVSVPVLIVRPQLVSTFTAEELDLRCRHIFRQLLIPYDGSEPSRYLIDRIKQQVADNSNHSLEKLHLCWVLDSSRRDVPVEPRIEAAKTELQKVAAELTSLNLQIEPEVRQGDPVTEILETSKMRDVSAIATSSGSIGKLFAAPSFAAELLRRSWHPLLFFPPKR